MTTPARIKNRIFTLEAALTKLIETRQLLQESTFPLKICRARLRQAVEALTGAEELIELVNDDEIESWELH